MPTDIQRLWARFKAALDAFGYVHSAIGAISLLAGAALAVPAAISAVSHDLAWPYLLLLILFIVGTTAWSVRQVFLMFGAPTIIRTRPEYAYCLAYTGLTVGFDESAQADALQIGIGLQNASAWPLEYHVKEFRIVIGDRTIPEPEYVGRDGGVIPCMTFRSYRYPSFARDVMGDRAEAVIEFAIAYGAPNAPPVRALPTPAQR